MRQDRQLLVITHLSQLLCFITGFGSLIVPLILWATQKERVYQMNEQFRELQILYKNNCYLNSGTLTL